MAINWELEHQKLVEANAKKIKYIYNTAVSEAGFIGASINKFNPDKPFSFADYPQTKARIDALLKSMETQVTAVIASGTTIAWDNANKKNTELVKSILGLNPKPATSTAQLDLFAAPPEAEKNPALKALFNNNHQAREAFMKRKEEGLGLSDRVWKFTNQFKTEIEMGLDDGIRNGRPAAEIARDLRQFLQEPDRVYKRFQMNLKDKNGNDVLDSNGNKIKIKQLRKQYKDPVTGAITWKVENPAYKPGQGVYRSSLKNAQRVARTETNMAYRTSDFTRAQQLPFIVGIEVFLSNAHKIIDICDVLQGKYPKEFYYRGWHPHCFCPVRFILKTREELKQDTQRILNGEPVTGMSVNRITSIPADFSKWVQDNKNRLQGPYKPYFIKDNYPGGDIAQPLIYEAAQAEVMKEAAKQAAEATKAAEQAKAAAETKAAQEKAEKLQKEAEQKAKEAINLNSQVTAIDMIQDPDVQKALEELGGPDWMADFYAKPQNYEEDIFYRVENGSGTGQAGAGKGLYLGKDKAALKAFYDIEGQGLPVSKFKGNPKFLNLMEKDNMAAFEKYLETKGLKLADSDQVGKIVEELGFDGIRYFDAWATGEEFVLFNTSKLVKVTKEMEEALLAAAKKKEEEEKAAEAKKALDAMNAKKIAQGWKKVEEAQKIGLTATPQYANLVASLQAKEPSAKTIQYRIDQMNIVIAQKKKSIAAAIAKAEEDAKLAAIKEAEEIAKAKAIEEAEKKAAEIKAAQEKAAQEQAAIAKAKAQAQAQAQKIEAVQAQAQKELVFEETKAEKVYKDEQTAKKVQHGKNKIEEAKSWGISNPKLDKLIALVEQDDPSPATIQYLIVETNIEIKKLKDSGAAPLYQIAKPISKTKPSIASAAKQVAPPKPKTPALDPLSKEALLEKYSEKEVDALFNAHQAFMKKIEPMTIDDKIKKLKFEVNHTIEYPKYTTSPDMTKLLKKELEKVLEEKEYQIVKSEAVQLLEVVKAGAFKDKGIAKAYADLKKTALSTKATSIELTAQKTNLEGLIAEYKKNNPTYIDPAIAKIKASEGRKKYLEICKHMDVEFFENGDKFDMSKHYTAEEKDRVRKLRNQLRELVLKYGGDEKNNQVRTAQQSLADELNYLSFKYVTKQPSIKHIGLKKMDIGGTPEFGYLTDAEAKATFDRYIKTPKQKENYYSAGVGGIYEPDKGTDHEERTNRYLEKLKNSGAKATKKEVSVPSRYFRGQSFINEYLKGIDRPSTDSWKQVLDDYSAANSYALNKMPRFNGYTFRGVNSMPKHIVDEIEECAKTGKPWTHKVTMSTSTDIKQAHNFGTDMVFKIYGKSGVYGNDFSYYNHEKEVLYRAGSRFEVLAFYTADSNDDITYPGKKVVVLREILE